MAENFSQSHCCSVQHISHRCGKAFSHKPTQSEAGKVNKAVRREKGGKTGFPENLCIKTAFGPALTREHSQDVCLMHICVMFSCNDVVLTRCSVVRPQSASQSSFLSSESPVLLVQVMFCGDMNNGYQLSKMTKGDKHDVAAMAQTSEEGGTNSIPCVHLKCPHFQLGYPPMHTPGSCRSISLAT